MSSSAQGNIGTRSSEADSSPGQERPLRWVGKYRILSELGRGGMSSVYLAVARGPGGVNKLVVLKAVLPELASEPGALAMFLDEARLGAQLNHANVVQTYEVGTEGDRHVIVMEYLEGQTLAHIVRRAEQNGTPLSIAMYLRIIMNALEGLHYAHELSAYDGSPLLLVHRDISPQNVFVTYGGQVKVLDFGIAKASSSSTHTATGVVKGKIAYMAPEQMIADSLDRRADIYSVGCMLWAAATGRKLWKDTPDVQIMRRVINGDIPTPQSVNVAVDDEFNKIVMTALAPDPAERYQTALALQEALEHYCERFSSLVKQKEIGAFISSLFADVRGELKSLVERQLALVLQDDSTGETESEVRVFGTSPGSRLGRSVEAVSNRATYRIPAYATAQSADGAAAQVAELAAAGGEKPRARANERPGRRRVLVWTLLAGLLIAAAFMGFSLRKNQELAPAASGASSVSAPPSVPHEQWVNLQLKADPPAAELYLDDQRLPGNPASSQLKVDGQMHRLRAQARGYEAASSNFSAVRDDTIAIVLTKSEAPASSAAVTTAARTPRQGGTGARSSRPSHASAAKVDCQQPFFVDTDGIKKFRPECL